MGVIRDEARNQRIDLPNEKGKKHFRGSFRTFVDRTHVRFSPIANALGLVFEP
jgi:5,5'-dehydrodivanillate O-demethylase